MLAETQLPARFRSIIDEQLEIYDTARSVTSRNTIPGTNQIPFEKQNYWLKVPDVICVFVDMKGSTRLSAMTHDTSTAGAYQLFTGTAVRLFHEFQTPYIDVRGDGVFALFNQNQVYRALAAAVTFKTFAREVFAPTIKAKTPLELGAHIGIDQRTVLVRRIGLKAYGGREDRRNEVWAGKPVNMASKLAGMGESDQLIVSDRYFARLKDEHATKSCGCPNGGKVDLWSSIDVSPDDKFNFATAYLLKSCWCGKCGKDFCEALLGLDEA